MTSKKNKKNAILNILWIVNGIILSLALSFVQWLMSRYPIWFFISGQIACLYLCYSGIYDGD